MYLESYCRILKYFVLFVLLAGHCSAHLLAPGLKNGAQDGARRGRGPFLSVTRLTFLTMAAS